MNDKPESEFELLIDGPRNAEWTLIMAHGAGQCMSSPFMKRAAVALAQAGLRVVRFELPYMAETRKTGNRSRRIASPDCVILGFVSSTRS